MPIQTRPVAVSVLLALLASAAPVLAQTAPEAAPLAAAAFTATPGLVETAAGAMAYLKAGSGPAVVIVHGIGGHKEDWQAVMAALATSHTVYAIDMIGFGGSAKTAPEITIDTQVAAVLALLEAEGVARADLIGNSVGGWVAASFAAAHPERTSRLIVANAAGFEAMFAGPSPVNFYPTTVEEMQQLLQTVLFAPLTHTPEYAAQALAALNASGDAVAAGVVFAGLGTSARLEAVMPRITAPTLVIWGAEDRLFPAGLAPYVAGLTAGAQVALVPEAGHFPQLDNPQGFLAAVQGFLRAAPKAATIASYPPGTFLENLAAGADGAVVVTSYFDRSLLRWTEGSAPAVLTTLDAHPVGILVRGEDIVLSVHGQPFTSGPAFTQTNAFVVLNADGTLRQTIPAPEALFLNGLVELPDGTVLAADSLAGRIWRLDTASGTITEWLADPLLTPDPASSRQNPGANGLKLRDGYLYISNSSRQTLYRVALADNAPASALEVFAQTGPIDDFAFLPDGTIAAATHGARVIGIDRDGQVSTLMAQDGDGCTAVLPYADGARLAILTTGNLLEGGTDPARILSLPVTN